MDGESAEVFLPNPRIATRDSVAPGSVRQRRASIVERVIPVIKKGMTCNALPVEVVDTNIRLDLE